VNTLYEKMNIQASCEVGNTIFKKLFYDNASMNAKDKEIFKDNIKKITWKYSLKEDTMNIPAYKDCEREYEEIAIIEVELEVEAKHKRIAEIIQKTIPYPLILVFLCNGKALLNLAHKKTNKANENQSFIEDMIFTDWIEKTSVITSQLDIKKMRFINFYALYFDIFDTVSIINLKKYILIDVDIKGEKARFILNQIELLDKEISNLKLKLLTETQYNRKVEMNINIKQLEGKRKTIIKENGKNE
jgi:hypothetical protein